MTALPHGWSNATIDDTGEYINGMAFKPADWGTEGLPIIRIQNLTDLKKDLNKTTRAVDSKYLVEDGDLLVSWSATLDAFVWNRGRAVLNQHIFKVVPEKRLVDTRFLFHGLREKIQEMLASEHLHGSTMKHINRGPFLAHPFAIPPLAEQGRIVAKIDSLTGKSQRAREHLDHIPRLVEKYKHAVLSIAFQGELTKEWRRTRRGRTVIPRPKNEMRAKFAEAIDFDEPYALPSTWRWLRLPELGELDRGRSRHRPRNDPALFGGDYPFVQTGEVRAASRFISNFTETYNEVGLQQSRLWPKGTVCITIAANIAETAILAFDACFPDSVVGFLPDVDKADASYVEFFMRTARSDLEAFAPATAQKNINLDTLSSVRIPIAPIEEQREIVRRIERALTWIDRLATEATSSRNLLARLDQTVLAKALRGQLVPQDSNDEPAGALLEQIRAEKETRPAASV